MSKLGPTGFWIAFAIVLLYLIAHPHVGKKWYINAVWVSPRATPSLDPLSAVMPSALPANADNPFMAAPVAGESPPPSYGYLVRTDCLLAQSRYEAEAQVTGAYCMAKTALLWGR